MIWWQTGLFGLLTGGLYALLGLGIVLVYRGTRVLNFAHGAMGMVATFFHYSLVQGIRYDFSVFGHRFADDVTLPWLAALPVSLLFAAVLGIVTERVVVRPLRNAPTLTLAIATLGWMLVLQGVAATVWGLETRFVASPWPDGAVRVGGVNVTYERIGVFAVALAVAAGVALVLARTTLGLRIRAVSQSPKVAELVGIRADRAAQATWAGASMLAALAGILLAPLVAVDTLSLTLFMVKGFAAAIFGGLVGLLPAFLGGLTVGALEGVTTPLVHVGGFKESVAFVIIIALLATRPRWAFRETRVEEDSGLAGRPAAPRLEYWAARVASALDRVPRPRLAEVPRAVRRVGRPAAAVALLGWPWLFPDYWSYSANLAIFYFLFALSFVILSGWVGQISLAQASFVGVGAFATATYVGEWGVPFLLAIPMSALTVLPFALAVGLPSLRLRGFHLAVATMAFGVMAERMLFNFRGLGVHLPRPRLGAIDFAQDRWLYYVFVAIAAALLVVSRRLAGSRHRRAFLALRDSPNVALSYGVAPTRTKLTAFMLSGAVAGTAGSLYAILLSRLQQLEFGLFNSMRFLAISVVAGITNVGGAVIAGLAFGLLPEIVRKPAGGESQIPIIVSGALTIVVMVANPGGLATMGRFLRRARSAHAGEQAALPAVAAAAEAPRATPALLEVEGADVFYGPVQAVRAVSLRVYPGEIVALLGTNGAGKSTLLDAISGLLPLARGAVRYAGVDLARATPAERTALGLVQVPAGRGVLPELTAAESLRAASLPHADRRAAAAEVERALDLFPALRARIDVAAGNLSGGEQQMLALARAMVLRPLLLAIDELSLGLAPVVVEGLVEALRRMRDDGVGVLLVEQNATLAIAIADRAYFLEKGEVRFAGRAADLARRDDLVRAVFLRGREAERAGART